MARQTFEFARMLVISTAHVTDYTCNSYFPHYRAACYAKGDYGYFLHVSEPHEADPADLRDVLEMARKADAEWLMIDRDGPTVSGLSTYDW
jgi:hypothetical protein